MGSTPSSPSQQSDDASATVDDGSNPVDPLCVLPPEVVIEIVRNLTAAEQASCRRVSRRWHAFFQDPYVWARMGVTYVIPEHVSNGSASWVQPLTSMPAAMRDHVRELEIVSASKWHGPHTFTAEGLWIIAALMPSLVSLDMRTVATLVTAAFVESMPPSLTALNVDGLQVSVKNPDRVQFPTPSLEFLSYAGNKDADLLALDCYPLLRRLVLRLSLGINPAQVIITLADSPCAATLKALDIRLPRYGTRGSPRWFNRLPDLAVLEEFACTQAIPGASEAFAACVSQLPELRILVVGGLLPSAANALLESDLGVQSLSVGRTDSVTLKSLPPRLEHLCFGMFTPVEGLTADLIASHPSLIALSIAELSDQDVAELCEVGRAGRVLTISTMEGEEACNQLQAAGHRVVASLEVHIGWKEGGLVVRNYR